MEAWKEAERPGLNQWYRLKTPEVDFLRIRKDFRDNEHKQTLYKVEEFYMSEIVAHGLTLTKARDYIKQFTWKKGY